MSTSGRDDVDDALLPPDYFEKIRNAKPVKVPLLMVNSFSELLVAIHMHNQPGKHYALGFLCRCIQQKIHFNCVPIGAAIDSIDYVPKMDE